MKKVFSLLFIFTVVADGAFAAIGGIDAGELNRQLSNDLRIHEAVTRAQNRDMAIKKEIQESQKNVSETQNGVQDVLVSDLQKVSFSGNVAVSEKKLQKLVSYKLGKPLTSETISSVRKTVMAYYQGQGFYSAVAVPDLSGIQNGELILKIKEGPRNSIQIEK